MNLKKNNINSFLSFFGMYIMLFGVFYLIFQKILSLFVDLNLITGVVTPSILSILFIATSVKFKH